MITEKFFQSLPNLTPDYKSFLDKLVTTQNIIDTIKALKTPGPDDYPSEFYKVFSGILAEPLTKAHNHILETGHHRGHMPKSF